MDKDFHTTVYWFCDYLSPLGLKLIHVSKRDPSRVQLVIFVVGTSTFYPYPSGLLTGMGACLSIDSLWPSDVIWLHKTGPTVAQIMACCLAAPNHYPNQCWLIISEVLWQSPESNLTSDTSISHQLSNQLEIYFAKISFKSPRGQWVKWSRVSSSIYVFVNYAIIGSDNVCYSAFDRNIFIR